MQGVLLYFKPVLEASAVRKVWHNYGFDRHVLYNHGINCMGFAGDTMHMARLWNTALKQRGGYSLEGLSNLLLEARKVPMKERFARPKINKDGGESKVSHEREGAATPRSLLGVVPSSCPHAVTHTRTHTHTHTHTLLRSHLQVRVLPPLEEVQRDMHGQRHAWIDYSTYDAEATWLLREALEAKLRARPWVNGDLNMFHFYERYLLPFGELLTDLEREGIFVDVRDHLPSAERLALEDRARAVDTFLTWAGRMCPDAAHMNVSSDVQKAHLLFAPAERMRPAAASRAAARVRTAKASAAAAAATSRHEGASVVEVPAFHEEQSPKVPRSGRPPTSPRKQLQASEVSPVVKQLDGSPSQKQPDSMPALTSSVAESLPAQRQGGVRRPRGRKAATESESPPGEASGTPAAAPMGHGALDAGAAEEVKSSPAPARTRRAAARPLAAGLHTGDACGSGEHPTMEGRHLGAATLPSRGMSSGSSQLARMAATPPALLWSSRLRGFFSIGTAQLARLAAAPQWGGRGGVASGGAGGHDAGPGAVDARLLGAPSGQGPRPSPALLQLRHSSHSGAPGDCGSSSEDSDYFRASLGAASDSEEDRWLLDDDGEGSLFGGSCDQGGTPRTFRETLVRRRRAAAAASMAAQDAGHADAAAPTSEAVVRSSTRDADRWPVERVFKIENTVGFIEAGAKAPKKHREIVLTGLGIPPVARTESGWPAVSSAVLRALAGKVPDARSAPQVPPPPGLDPAPSPLLIGMTRPAAPSAPAARAPSSAPVYGPAYDYFGGGEEGASACVALHALYSVSVIDTMLSNFIVPLQMMADAQSRVHCSLNLNTETGRLSARRPNLQVGGQRVGVATHACTRGPQEVLLPSPTLTPPCASPPSHPSLLTLRPSEPARS